MDSPRITRRETAFSLWCRVELDIRADATAIWTILTDASAYPSWNGTISHIEGEIREGERLRLHVPGTTRTFAPTVRGLVPDRQMHWVGGLSPFFKGVRTFQLEHDRAGPVQFLMEERFSGLMIPLVKKSLPDFGPIFARFATDLRREAERQHPPRAT